jgi:hypothetical protein
MSRFTTHDTARALGRLAILVASTLVLVLPAAAQSLAAASFPDAQAAQAPAEQDTGFAWTSGWSYGARGVVSLLTEDSLETGVGFTGFAVLPLATDFELEGEIGYQTMNTVADGLPAGRLSMFPLRASLRVQLWRFGGAKPYAGGGAGLYISRFSLDDAVLDELATVGFGAETDVDPGIGFHALGGIEWERGRFHFGADVKYVFGNTDAVSTVVDQVTEQVIRETSELSFDGFWIAAGARFSF